MAEDWKAYNKEVKKALKSDGAKSIVRIKSIGDYDIATGKKQTTSTDHVVYIIFNKVNNINEQLNRDEMAVLCSPEDISFDMSNIKNMYLVFKNIEFEIIDSRPVMPGGIALFYKLICRR